MRRRGVVVLEVDGDDDAARLDGAMARWWFYFDGATGAKRHPLVQLAALAALTVLVLLGGLYAHAWYTRGRGVCTGAQIGGVYHACVITDPRPPADAAVYADLRGLQIVAPGADAIALGAVEVALRGLRAHVSVPALDWALRSASREQCVCAVDLALPIDALGVGGTAMFAPRIDTATATTNRVQGRHSPAAAATGFDGREFDAPQETRVSYETLGGRVSGVRASAVETACIVWCRELTAHVVTG